ncbi:MAG: hypothetical protein DMG79_18065 [Acidobacteria bacterium]|nr:MAG: hypothetical protein DMG79_18065 [Acidobacteriota bacterium]
MTKTLVVLSLLAVTTLASGQSNSPLPKSPVSTGVLMARAVRAGKVQLRGSVLSDIAPPLTCSPAPCALPNQNASKSSVLANETPVVVNPLNSQQILTGANDYACANVQGFYASSDGGTTWKRTCLNALAGDFGEGDPGVAYDLNGKAYITGIDANHGIVMETSTDNGTTWSPVKLAVGPYFSGGLTDKPWLEIDTNRTSPRANAIYISVTQFDSSETNIVPTVSHSTDGGTTWVTKQVDTTQVYPNVDQFSDLAIGRDGTVYVSWMRCTANGPSGDCGGTISTMYWAKSTDGGNTWTSPAKITTAKLAPDPGFCCFYGSLPNTSERVSNIPAIAIDNYGSHPGNLYVTYYNWTGSQMKAYVAVSTDGGATWSAKAVAPATATNDQFFPWVNVSRNGVVGVSWMDRRDDPANINYEAFSAVSVNGGASYGTNLKLSAAASDPFNDGFGGFFIGDYTGNAWAGTKLYVVYTDTTTGIDQDFLTGEKVR